ncbi:LppA family lipoprotein [Rhodococcus sp. NPDC127528]|uniref:LppA family lipoprotein n=1 Tax=unclassified Rhodococcus (in: high G+C Gram-positive bacteria) TaxID=192944 RepID=UPI0036454A78
MREGSAVLAAGGRGVVLAVVAATVAGCAATGGEIRVDRAEAVRRTAILASRASLEEAATQAESLGEAIRGAVSAAVPVGPWHPNRPPSDAGNCIGFTHTAGQSRTTGTWLIDGGIPDESWLVAVAAVRSVTDRHGYGAPIVAVDRPNDHALRIYGPGDAYVWFGAGKNGVLDLTTACHLPESTVPRTTPGVGAR